MKLAFTKIDITPQLPVPLSGFGVKRIAESVHDAQYARLFLFEGKKTILWVQMDLVAVDNALLSKVKTKTGLKDDEVLLSATHTHSGAGGTLSTHEGLLKGMDPIFCDYNDEYCESIADKIAEAVKELKEQTKESELRMIRGTNSGLGTERHDAALAADYDTLVMELTSGEKKALIVRMACHPTVLNAANLAITADFPGAIEPHFEDYELVAYVNGSCGDMSTRFTRKGQGFEECARFGKLAADHIKELLESSTSAAKPYELELLNTAFTVDARTTDPLPVALEKLEKAKKEVEQAMAQGITGHELRVIQSFYEGAQNNLLASKSLSGITEISVPVSALKLPELTLIFTPCELFSKLSNPYKKNGLEFVGYTNGYQLYMADEEAYEKQFYEASSSPYAKGAGESLMQQINSWISTK